MSKLIDFAAFCIIILVAGVVGHNMGFSYGVGAGLLTFVLAFLTLG